MDTIWDSWMRAYPAYSDYNWAPLKLLFNDWANFRELRASLQNIRNTYPNSKLIPYVDYELARSTQELAGVAKKYPKEVFPEVASEFLTAWKHLPAPGVRIAALAQMRIASQLYSFDGFVSQKTNMEQGIHDWQKVLGYYPKLFSKDKSITDDEWRRIILISYFALLSAYTEQGNSGMADKTAEEILKQPDLTYGDNYGRRSHAEIYLWKAERLADKKNYSEAEKYLELVARDYTNIDWGYHGGIGESYYTTSAKMARMLPIPDSIKILTNYSTDIYFQNHLSDRDLAWTDLMRAGLLLDAGRKAEAEELLKATCLLYPKETKYLIEDHSPQIGLDSYFPYEGDTPLAGYYKSIQNIPLKESPVADSTTVKQLLPPGATVAKAFPIKEIVAGDNLDHLVRTQTSQKDCIVYADLDADGVDELAIAYSTPVIEKGYTDIQSHLSIYKHIGDSWVLQYSQELGSVVYEFDAVRLFRRKPGKQLLVSSGAGASIGYGLFVIQYRDGKYQSLLSEKDSTLNWGITVSDLDADTNKEILTYQRYWPFPAIYSWNSKDGLFEVLSGTSPAILKNLYSSTINSIKTPFGSDGKFNDSNAWKLFISYDKLGDFPNAIKVGNELLDYQRKSEGGYNWFEYVNSRLMEIEGSQSKEK
jgi:tetratricopeptide (TPR) repeat protein